MSAFPVGTSDHHEFPAALPGVQPRAEVKDLPAGQPITLTIPMTTGEPAPGCGYFDTETGVPPEKGASLGRIHLIDNVKRRLQSSKKLVQNKTVTNLL